MLNKCLAYLMIVALITSNGLAFAESEDSVESGQETDSKPLEVDEIPERMTSGLDKKVLKLVNAGDWKGAAERLESMEKDNLSPTRIKAWLAFCYMFLENCKALAELKKQSCTEEVAPELKAYKLSIEAFDQICQGKPEAAESTLKGLPRAHANDAFINFALAAVAAKNGKAGAAVEYCRRSTALDPQFGWGFRTCGYLELRWLDEPKAAEESFARSLAIEPRQAEVQEMLIGSLMARNDFDRAIDVANKGIKANPKAGDAYYKLAKIYLKQWRYREALEQLSKAIKLDPDRAVYYRTVSRVENSKGNIEEAIANQNKAVALSKDKSFELTELASMNRSAGHLDAAVLNLMEAIEINPENLTAHKQLVGLLIKQKRWDELVSEYKRVLKTKKKDSSLHYHLGEALLAMDKTDEAMAQYKLAANLNQSDPRPLRKLGAIYVGQKEFDKAIKVYTKALNSQPSPEVKDLVALGYCYAQNDSYLHAEAGFLTALALQQFPGYKSDSGPKREDILRSLASLLLIEGRYADASSQFESLYGMTRNTDSANDDQFLLRQSRALSSRKPEAIDELLSSFSKLGKDKQEAFRYSLVQSLLRLERAKDALSQIDEVKKTEVVKEPKWMILKARAKRQLKDMDEAAGILDRALEIANQDADEKPSLLADALVERARLKVELKALDEAETSATKALEVYAKMYASYLVLARVSLGNGKADDAIALARKALEQNPYFTEAYITIGDAYMKKQDYQKALEHYKKATELYPAYLSGHRGLLEAYKRLELSEEIRKEEDQIAQLEKIQ